MSEADKREIARYLAEELKGHQCQFSEEDRVTLREFSHTLRAAKSTAMATLVGAVVLFAFGALGIGLVSKIWTMKP